MPEILLYGEIGSESAQRFIREIEAAAGEDITVRISSNGGSPEDMFGMVAKFREYPGKKIVKVDGQAYSAGAFFLPYADKVEALDVSQFLFHRAAYSPWFEKSEYMTAEKWENLDKINASLKAAVSAKIDVKMFEQLKGIKFADLWNNETRIDVFFDAKDAKKIGLIDSIVKITPAKRAELNTYFQGVAAKYVPQASEEEPEEENLPISNTMTLEELKSKHPEVYAQAVKAGETQERDRVGAWMAFVDADAEAVAKGIKEGQPLSMTAMAEFNRKLLTKGLTKQAEEDSPKDTPKAEEPKTAPKEDEDPAKATALAAFEAELDRIQGKEA